MGLLDDAIREHLELKRRHGANPDEVARQENEALGETRRAEFARPEGEAPAAEVPEPVAEDSAVSDFGAVEAPEPPAFGRDEPSDAVSEGSDEPFKAASAAPAEPEPDAPSGVVSEGSDEPFKAASAAPAEPEPEAHEPFDVEADEPPAVEAPAPEEEAPEAEVGDVPEFDEPPEMPGEPEPEPSELAARPAAREPEPGDEEDPWLVEDLADSEPRERAPEADQPAAPAEGDDVLEETPDFLQETPEHDRLWFEQKPPRDFDWDK